VDYTNLIDRLIEGDYLKTPLIIEAFKNIQRDNFLPPGLKNEAGFNGPLPIGFGQTNSQPATVAFMLELLQPQLGDKILDIGSGSGWTSALLAYCVGKSGKVIAIEKIPELCEFGKTNISKYNFIEKGLVEFICTDATPGLPNEAPFDGILASASASEIPGAWPEQLRVNGRLVLPVRNSVWLIKKISKNKFQKREYPGFAFVPLISNWTKK